MGLSQDSRLEYFNFTTQGASYKMSKRLVSFRLKNVITKLPNILIYSSKYIQ